MPHEVEPGQIDWFMIFWQMVHIHGKTLAEVEEMTVSEIIFQLDEGKNRPQRGPLLSNFEIHEYNKWWRQLSPAEKLQQARG